VESVYSVCSVVDYMHNRNIKGRGNRLREYLFYLMSQNRLVIDYEQLLDLPFWKLFIEKIVERRAYLSRRCETEENPIRFQGGLEAIDFILGRGTDNPSLAERIIRDIREKSGKGE